MDLRWVYVHMIEEYARHNGHADLLREQIDGANRMTSRITARRGPGYAIRAIRACRGRSGRSSR